MSTLNSLTAEAVAKAPPAGQDPMASFPARPRKGPPVHPGAVIADIFEDRGVSLRQVEAATGISKSLLSKITKGKGPVMAETAVVLAAYFGNERSSVLWMDMQRDYDLWHARAELASVLKKIKPLSA